jgi:hypothetical protein
MGNGKWDGFDFSIFDLKGVTYHGEQEHAFDARAAGETAFKVENPPRNEAALYSSQKHGTRRIRDCPGRDQIRIHESG